MEAGGYLAGAIHIMYVLRQREKEVALDEIGSLKQWPEDATPFVEDGHPPFCLVDRVYDGRKFQGPMSIIEVSCHKRNGRS